MPTPRSFLLTVHEPGSAVLEDLSTAERVHVADLGTLGAQIARWLEASDGSAGEDALLQHGGRFGGLDAELVDERAAAREDLP
jgi:hypothetical protein